jgi:hypothetical protein
VWLAQTLQLKTMIYQQKLYPESTVIDRRLTSEDIDWLRKLRNAKAANQLSADIPTSVVRRLTQLACAEVRGGLAAITMRGRDELIERERETH